jgi:hypothetical protein
MVDQRITTTSGAETVLQAATIEQFKGSVRGELLCPGDAHYDSARSIHNGMIDRHPALIVRCAGVADIMHAVTFARRHDMVVAVRGGGHGVPGFAVCDGGLMIDLSRMKGVRVDSVDRTARAEGGCTWGDFDHETQAFGLATTGGIARAFSQYFLHDVRVTQVQLDDLYALLSAIKDGEVSEAEAIKRLSRSPHWVWVAIDPVSKLLLAIDVGAHTLAMAQRFVHQVARVLAPGCVPVFLTDGFKEYTTALLAHFGHWVQPERRQAKGPRPKPRWMPLPQPLPTHGNGSAKRWQPRTPAMAAGLTDHVWTLREVLLFRVPPQPQAV